MGSLKHLYQGSEHDCGPIAVQQVRRFGGVLEHPAKSKLWDHCGLPKPGDATDPYGCRTYEVCQCDWGHVARKRTWLYVVGVDQRWMLARICKRAGTGVPTHWVSGFRSSTGTYPATYKRTGCAVPPGIKVCSAQQRRRTPRDFAEFLLEIARRARSIGDP